MTPTHGTRLTLYVVPIHGDGRLDPFTEEVAGAFARGGFDIVVHAGPSSVTAVVDGTRRSDSLSVLLSSDGHEPELRALTRALVDDGATYVVAVGTHPLPEAEQREGDRADPVRIHPDEGSERLAWLVGFMRRGLIGDALAAWFRRVVATEAPASTVIAFNLGLFETEGGMTAYLMGAEHFDPDDPNWACDQAFTPRERYLTLLPRRSEATWQEVLGLAREALRAFIQSPEGRSSFLGKAEAVTVGFDDGNLVRVN